MDFNLFQASGEGIWDRMNIKEFFIVAGIVSGIFLLILGVVWLFNPKEFESKKPFTDTLCEVYDAHNIQELEASLSEDDREFCKHWGAEYGVRRIPKAVNGSTANSFAVLVTLLLNL